MPKYDLEYWRNRALLAEAALAPVTNVPKEWELSGKELELVSVLLDGKTHQFGEIIDRIYFNQDAPGDPNGAIKVFVYRIRRKLRRFGVEVKNVWGQGYYLTQRSEAHGEAKPKEHTQ
jgi:two-component system cell cycle response regulator CtrA